MILIPLCKLFFRAVEKKVSVRFCAKTNVMCGRFSLATSVEKLQQQLPFVENLESFKVSYNIAPTQHAYIVTNEQPGKLQYLNWGLIPHWSKDDRNAGKLINARSEGIETRSSFRVPVRKRRCLVPADSFYEWKKDGVNKIPYRILLENGDLLMMAGIWDIWFKGDYGVKTFSIITTEPNREMKSLHNRMPVLLTNIEEMEKWLVADELSEALDLLETPADGILKMYRVSTTVNKVSNNTPELHQEVPEPPSLF